MTGLRTCRECNLPFEHAGRMFCTLCRQWFCEPCYRDRHWWTCERNWTAKEKKAKAVK